MLDVTVGGNSSNSYGSLNEAETYFANRLDTEDWDNAEQEEQERALIQATFLLDELDYVGEPATDTQALKWPRVDDDIFTLVWDDDEIPPKLKLAQFELALSLLAVSPGTEQAETVGAGQISSLSVGPVTVRYDTALTQDTTGMGVPAARFLRGLRLPAVLA